MHACYDAVIAYYLDTEWPVNFCCYNVVDIMEIQYSSRGFSAKNSISGHNMLWT